MPYTSEVLGSATLDFSGSMKKREARVVGSDGRSKCPMRCSMQPVGLNAQIRDLATWTRPERQTLLLSRAWGCARTIWKV